MNAAPSTLALVTAEVREETAQHVASLLDVPIAALAKASTAFSLYRMQCLNDGKEEMAARYEVESEYCASVMIDLLGILAKHCPNSDYAPLHKIMTDNRGAVQ